MRLERLMLLAAGQAGVLTPARLPSGERGVWGSAPRCFTLYIHMVVQG